MRRTLLPLVVVTCTASAQFGTLDPTFDGDGIVQTEVEQPSIGNAVAIQSNGRILVGGNADSTGTIVRYMPDGSLDASFGTNGVVVFAPPVGPGELEFTITEIAVLSNGKILAAGRATYYLTSPLQQIYVARFNSNGTVDNTFGGNGTGKLSINLSSQEQGYAWELLPQADGKILFQGTRTAVSTGSLTYRLLANGTYDTSFGSGGEALWGWVIYTHTRGTSIAVQADGKVLVGGWLASPTESDRFVRRLTAQGQLDPTYGVDGLVLLDEGIGYTEIVSDILLQSDGKLLVVGSVSTPTEQRFRVTRLLADGTIDASYGTNGNVDGPVVNGAIEPKRGHLQSDGKLVFATHVTNSGTTRSMLWRLDTDGDLDPSFGVNGQVLDPCGSGASKLHHVAQQSDGKLLICGQGPGGTILTAARLSSGPVGIDEEDTLGRIVIFPNPAEGNFTLRSSARLERADVLDAQGRVVHSETNVLGDRTIDISALSSGAYVLRAFGKNAITSLPLIKP